MKVLIGTPIHKIKDYCMEKWIENVSILLKKYPADLLLVDNSPDLCYIEKIKSYLAKYSINNYKIKHLEINQEQPTGERIGRSREIIRQEFLKGDYDAWFSWESDQIIPIDALDKLCVLMQKGKFMIVIHISWNREYPSEPAAYFGCALIRRDALEKYSFLLESDPDNPQTWHRTEEWFKRRVLKGGGNYIEVSGVIKPIEHLNG